MLYTAIAALIARKRPFTLLAVLLVGLLFNELLVKWATFLLGLAPDAVLAISLWKEGTLAGLGVVLVWSWLTDHGRMTLGARLTSLGLMDLALAAVVLVGIFAMIAAPNRTAALAAFRDYYEPLLVFVFARRFLPSRNQITRLLRIWLGVGALMAALGLLQTFFWDASDYLRFGFGEPISDMGVPPLALGGQTILRAPSFVTGPNELGMHMVLMLLYTSYRILQVGLPKNQTLLLGSASLLYAICLAYTYSRGDLIALPAGIAVLLLARWAKNRSVPLRGWQVVILTLIVVSALSFLNGTAQTLVETVTGFSEDYHIVDTGEAIDRLFEQPGGVGLGLVGPRRGVFFPTNVAFHVEGSVFQLAFEMGIWGLAVWVIFVFAALRKAWRVLLHTADPMVDSLAATAVSGWIASIPVQLFIPLMQSLPMMSWMWFFLGLAVEDPDFDRAA